MSEPTKDRSRRRLIMFVIAAGITGALVTIAIALLLVNISTRKHEGWNPYFRVVELTEDTVDPAVWGKNFPIQFDGYSRTVDQVRTRYGGSEAVPRTPSAADPRSVTAQSRLEEDPRLKTIWNGYAFAVDFRGRVEVDDALVGHVRQLDLHGHGMVMDALLGLLRPKLEQIRREPIPIRDVIGAFVPAALGLSNLAIAVSDDVSLTAEFGGDVAPGGRT